MESKSRRLGQRLIYGAFEAAPPPPPPPPPGDVPEPFRVNPQESIRETIERNKQNPNRKPQPNQNSGDLIGELSKKMKQNDKNRSSGDGGQAGLSIDERLKQQKKENQKQQNTINFNTTLLKKVAPSRENTENSNDMFEEQNWEEEYEAGNAIPGPEKEDKATPTPESQRRDPDPPANNPPKGRTGPPPKPAKPPKVDSTQNYATKKESKQPLDQANGYQDKGPKQNTTTRKPPPVKPKPNATKKESKQPPDQANEDEFPPRPPSPNQAEDVFENGAEYEPSSSWDDFGSGEESGSEDEFYLDDEWDNTVLGLQTLWEKMNEIEDWAEKFNKSVRDKFEELGKDMSILHNNDLYLKTFTDKIKSEQERMEQMMADMQVKLNEWEKQYEPVKDLDSLPRRMQEMEQWANKQYETVQELYSLPGRMEEVQKKIQELEMHMQEKGVKLDTFGSQMKNVYASFEKIKRDYTSLIDKLEETFTIKKDRVRFYEDPLNEDLYDINYLLEEGETSLKDSLRKNTVKFATFFYQ